MFLNKIKKFSPKTYAGLVAAGKRINFGIVKDDSVVVISGDDKGKTGKVVAVLKKKHMVIVSGVNLVKKTVKQKDGANENGFVFVEKPIHISNVKKAG